MTAGQRDSLTECEQGYSEGYVNGRTLSLKQSQTHDLWHALIKYLVRKGGYRRHIFHMPTNPWVLFVLQGFLIDLLAPNVSSSINGCH